jgi:D-lactate dehydrogenase (cytochrome)
VETVEALATGHGAKGFEWADTLEERNRLWTARHNAYYAGLALKPGAKAFSSDVCVPISRLADCLAATEADCAASAVTTTIVGHVGDGNFHVLFIVDPDNPGEMEAAKALNDRIVSRALEMESTCTGEHGVGYGKMAFLEAEHGPDALNLMRAVKQALDPDGIMNPGKIVRM